MTVEAGIRTFLFLASVELFIQLEVHLLLWTPESEASSLRAEIDRGA